jgi:hypothetical protein
MLILAAARSRFEWMKKGQGQQLFCLVKYAGLDDPQWEPWQNLCDGAE